MEVVNIATSGERKNLSLRIHNGEYREMFSVVAFSSLVSLNKKRERIDDTLSLSGYNPVDYFLMNFMLWLLLPLVMLRMYMPEGRSRTSTQLPSACFTKLPATL